MLGIDLPLTDTRTLLEASMPSNPMPDQRTGRFVLCLPLEA